MPLYDFKCIMCDHEYEKIVPFDTVRDGWLCPMCGGQTRKMVASSNFILNGTGWASDGYGNKTE